MALRISWLIVTVFTLVMNYLATSLPLNGMSTKALSDGLSTLITPAGFTFGIWSVIYIWIIILTGAIVWWKVKLSDKTMIAYIISALANGLRIVARHYQNLHLSMILMLVLLVSLIIMDRDMLSYRDRIASYNRVRASILIYIGWVNIASLVMLMMYLQYQLERLGWYEHTAALISIILAGCLNLLVICRERVSFTALVALRALYGIISWQTDPQIILTAQVMIGLLIAAVIWHEWRKLLKK